MPITHSRILTAAIVLMVAAAPSAFAQVTPAAPYDPKLCPSCAEWNVPHVPVRIFGNSYFVGTSGLSALLITSPTGHVLIDAGLPESATHIASNITALGFRLGDVKLIVNSHAHYDHAGGIAALQRATTAQVAASLPSARMIRTGKAMPDDPQFQIALPYPAVPNVREFKDGDTLRVGTLAIVAHLTPGHTPGGTTWSWQSCDGGRCLDLVYADSQTPISDDEFKYSANTRYPHAVSDFAKGHATIEALRCDILITPHPSATNLWARLAARDSGGSPALIDGDACKRYAAAGRAQLEKRLAAERAERK